HWSIGSGTKLALEDAISLARAFVKHRNRLKPALAEFELERQPVVDRLQDASRVSCEYFQTLQRYFTFEPLQFAYQLMTRTPRITRPSPLPVGAEAAGRGAGAPFAGRAPGRLAYAAPPPVFTPLRVRSLTIPNRLVFLDGPLDEGAGLVITVPYAVSPEGRIALDTPTVIGPPLPQGSLVCVQLGHARRGSACRPRRFGVDRPLRSAEAWPACSASPIAHAPWMPVPRELDREGMDRVTAAFVAAARHAEEGGHRMLLLDFAHGGLLASFISPVANRRQDEVGGSLENPMRFPVQGPGAARAASPPPLA